MGNKISWYNTIEDLIDTSGETDGEVAILHGYYSSGDGGGGTFYWDSSLGSGDDDGGTILYTDGGCWVRSYDDKIDARWFGAKADGVTDDADEIQLALDVATKRGHTLRLSSGSYLIGTTISVREDDNGARIVGDGIGVTKLIANRISTVVSIDYAETVYSIVHLDGFTIDGQGETETGILMNTGWSFCNWGTVRVINCDYGLRLYDDCGASQGIYSNRFDTLVFQKCKTGIELRSDNLVPRVNANSFSSVTCLSCNHGVVLNGACSNVFVFVFAEGCSGTGIDIIKGSGNRVMGGHLESNGLNLSVRNEAGDFVCLCRMDDASKQDWGDNKTDRTLFVPSKERNTVFGLNGAWSYRKLQSANPADGINGAVENPVFLGATLRNRTVKDGSAGVDVSGVNVISLSYPIEGAPHQITALSGYKDWQTVTLIASNENAYIADSGQFKLSSEWRPNIYDTLTLIRWGGSGWVEISRSGN